MPKKHKLLIACLIIMTMLGMSLTGCAMNTQVAAQDLMEGIERNNIQLPESMDQEVKQALVDFAWNFFQESADNEGNVMVSPPSAYLALSMTLNGADGETKDAMLKALSAQGITLEDLNKGLAVWMNSLNQDSEVKLNIANSIWVRDDFEVNQDFLQTNGDYYQAGTVSLDFSDPKAPELINKWVELKTEGTIDKIIEEIKEDMVMYLINAIYFNGDWKDQFDPNDTHDRSFYAPQGEVNTPFMKRSANMEYFERDGVTGVVLPYLDERFAFVGILPKEGEDPRSFIKNTSATHIEELINKKEIKHIDLYLPKFESSFEDELKDELSTLGMGIAFDPNQADFSLMNKARAKNLVISEVKHKTFVKVDEKGTEASAVTSVGMRLTSMPLEENQVFFDRPFVYAIMDWETNSPVFVGIMEDPTAQ